MTLVTIGLPRAHGARAIYAAEHTDAQRRTLSILLTGGTVKPARVWITSQGELCAECVDGTSVIDRDGKRRILGV